MRSTGHAPKGALSGVEGSPAGSPLGGAAAVLRALVARVPEWLQHALLDASFAAVCLGFALFFGWLLPDEVPFS